MRNIKMYLQFDGTRYSGWQKLGDDDNTIQGKMESLIGKMTGEKISVIGCSRTDKGVHAKSLVCNFFTKSQMGTDEMMSYINKYLPEDISLTYIDNAAERFHSRHNASSKTYIYTIDNGPYRDVFLRKFASYTGCELDLKLMQKAADYLVGTHDFEAFTTMKSKKKSSTRTITGISISKKSNVISITYEGDGFLHNMLRIITGTLLRVGRKEISPEDVANILLSKDRSTAGPIAESKGLCLVQVDYKQLD